jgi:hypothetical protein
VRGPGLSRITKLSKYLNANAKNVTNLLILLSVLAVGHILKLSRCRNCHGKIFFYSPSKWHKFVPLLEFV